MRFAFTEDQIALRDAVRDLLANECSPEVVRAAWPAPDADGQGPGAGARSEPGRIDALWSRIAEMGVLGVAVSEDQGGLGMGALDWVLVAEEFGYAAAPVPFTDTALVGAPLLAQAGDPLGNLSAVIGGELLLATQLDASAAVALAPSVGSVLLRCGGELRCIDASDLVAAAEVTTGVDGSQRLVAVDREGSATLGRVVDASAGDVEAAFDRGALASAAELVGLSRRMLEIAVGYVKERKQFGVPIGSFQAVKHHLADARLRLEFAAPAVYRAAWSLAEGATTAQRDISMAKAMASDAAHVVSRKVLQVHGGIGYTVEYDLHLFMKRAWAREREWGTAAWHRDRLGRSIGV